MNDSAGGLMTPQDIKNAKGRRKIVALTALDAPTASWCARAGVDIVLVGDSLGMTSLGMDDTTTVSMESMIQATHACFRGLPAHDRPLLVADLPECALRNPVETSRLLIDSGADAVKIECHTAGMTSIESVRAAGIEVMAHVGLLPQEAARGGGYRLRGVSEDETRSIIDAARKSEELGCFSCVVEKVRRSTGRLVTESIGIPTIGIGAGIDCDGQILVLYDMLGIFERFHPKFVRRYAEIGSEAVTAMSRFVADVRSGNFPAEKESFE